MPLKESGEMYLESIYVLLRSKSSVRSIDIAEHMNFSRASVCRGVGLLKKQDLILMDKDGYITLTDKGIKIAEKIGFILMSREDAGMGNNIVNTSDEDKETALVFKKYKQ